MQDVLTIAGRDHGLVPLDLLASLAVVSLIPLLVVMCTSFVRIVVVLSLVRSAIGASAVPPNALIVGLALVLTLVVMGPTISRVRSEAIAPYASGRASADQTIGRAIRPLRAFMLRQTRPQDIALFERAAHRPLDSPQRAPIEIVVPAYAVGELRSAFAIGFALYLPFVAIDLAVAGILMGLGMMMLSPPVVSLPVKLLLFVLVDGWALVCGGVVASFVKLCRMRIDDALAGQRPFSRLKFFPPKDDAGEDQLVQTAMALRPLRPAFVSVTYGAGGSTRARTLGVAKRITTEVGLTVMAHATLVGASRSDLRTYFDELARAGIQNVLALRGDPPRGSAGFVATPGGYDRPAELIAMLARSYDFSIGAACYPETHVESTDARDDLVHALEKVRAGAQFLITQLFFDNDKYFGFVERARAIGIDVPILPGIMPLTNFEQIDRFTKMCGATIPPKLRVELEARSDDAQAVTDLGVAYATLQCTDLLRRGAPGIHFYTLNRSPATRAIVSSLVAASAWKADF